MIGIQESSYENIYIILGFTMDSCILTFLWYFSPYCAVIMAPLPFFASTTMISSENAAMIRFLLGKYAFWGLTPGSYSESNSPFLSI